MIISSQTLGVILRSFSEISELGIGIGIGLLPEIFGISSRFLCDRHSSLMILFQSRRPPRQPRPSHQVLWQCHWQMGPGLFLDRAPSLTPTSVSLAVSHLTLNHRVSVDHGVGCTNQSTMCAIPYVFAYVTLIKSTHSLTHPCLWCCWGWHGLYVIYFLKSVRGEVSSAQTFSSPKLCVFISWWLWT